MLRKKKSLVDRAVDSAGDAVDAAIPVIENAVTQAIDLAKDTKTKAAPLVADTKLRAGELAGEIAEATREVAIPKAKSAAAAGAATAVGLAASGKDLAAAKVAEVKGEPPKRKGSKFRKLLFWGTVAAAAGYAYQKIRPTPETDNWQSAYTPPASPGTSSTTSATTGSTAGATGGTHLAPGVGPDEPLATDDPMAKLAAEEAAGDDSGGADPAEAIADAVEEPHAVTTPDDPADVVEIEDGAAKKK